MDWRAFMCPEQSTPLVRARSCRTSNSLIIFIWGRSTSVWWAGYKVTICSNKFRSLWLCCWKWRPFSGKQWGRKKSFFHSGCRLFAEFGNIWSWRSTMWWRARIKTCISSPEHPPSCYTVKVQQRCFDIIRYHHFRSRMNYGLFIVPERCTSFA